MRRLAPLVFCSGCCALVYQIGWLRELRLVFGASTYATSAVLAIFMGGLGIGGAVLGRRADRHPSPLRLYGLLEVGVAAGALASPLLFAAIRRLYFATGGEAALGQTGALAIRLVLSTLVLALPTFLMGGTLPAAAKEAEPLGGGNRRNTALLYGVNAIGALCGVVATTFFLLERFGTRATVLSAATLNLVVGATALLIASRQQRRSPDADVLLESGDHQREREKLGRSEAGAPPVFVFVAAAITGFVFFLMEIVWYRMLSPLLGGTTYSFGLILATVLAGIGVGGAFASFLGGRFRPTVRLFAATCGLEALGIALAFGLGDRVALLALTLRPEGEAGLALFLAGWAIVCAVVVFPGALVAGFQFPLLISLLGRGGAQLGRHAGSVYLWNTAGAITGALAGGFGLLPALGALGCWRLAVILLGVLCVAAVVVRLPGAGRSAARAVAVASMAAAGLLVALEGPTVAWRHSPIGAGLATRPATGAAYRAWINNMKYSIPWERDGIESAVALNRREGLAFVVNGKTDGNAKLDAGTQVMAPLVGAILHPQPRKALVIGLGTGSSAGWLAAVGSIERVDVAELEPAVIEVARRCAPVNRDVLSNPKVRVILGDARELLMTAKQRYDLIFSEPSNPYRAGVASLYTQDFYRAVADHLAPGGLFSQWIQAYGVEAETIGQIAATLASVFGDVEVWQTTPGDLLFVCSSGPKDYSVPALAARVAGEPFRSGLFAGWGVAGLEGFLSGFFATDAFARHAAGKWGRDGVNTDDRSAVEFGFVRAFSSNRSVLSLAAFRADTRERGANRPAVRDAAVDWSRVDADQLLSLLWQPSGQLPLDQSPAGKVFEAYQTGDLAGLVRAWETGAWQPVAALEDLMLAEALAEQGDRRALSVLPDVARVWPGSAAAIEAVMFQRSGETNLALAALERAVAGFRVDPWNSWEVMNRTLAFVLETATADPRVAGRLFDLLVEPFSVNILEWERVYALVTLATLIDCRHGELALAQFEPNVPRKEGILRYRAECYAKSGNPLLGKARRDLESFLDDAQ
jgi:spermidine synthase